MNNGKKRVTFAKYKLKKWSIIGEKYEKTIRKPKDVKVIDMREKNIEEELIQEHEEIYNKKEECSKRMANRDLAIHGLINPYMFNNNYLEDLSNQDQYLRPQDSNIRTKDNKYLKKD